MFEKFRTPRESETFLRQNSLRWREGEREREKGREKKRIQSGRRRRPSVKQKFSTRIEKPEKTYGNLSRFCIMRKLGVEPRTSRIEK